MPAVGGAVGPDEGGAGRCQRARPPPTDHSTDSHRRDGKAWGGTQSLLLLDGRGEGRGSHHTIGREECGDKDGKDEEQREETTSCEESGWRREVECGEGRREE